MPKIAIDKNGIHVIPCVECARWIPAEEYAYGHDCEREEK